MTYGKIGAEVRLTWFTNIVSRHSEGFENRETEDDGGYSVNFSKRDDLIPGINLYAELLGMDGNGADPTKAIVRALLTRALADELYVVPTGW